MKKIFSLVLLCLLVHWGFAQINVVAPDGDVGVGTETPEEKLDIAGNLSVRGGALFVGSEAGATDANIKIGLNRTASGNSYIDLVSNLATDAGFGARFIRFSNGLSTFSHKGTNTLAFRTINNANFTIQTANTERFRITPTGTVGIGTLTPDGSALLHVNGDAVKPGGGTWDVPSDQRLKSNVQPYADGLAQILQINPITYRYNGKAGISSNKEHVGIVAQELQRVAPYMVTDYVFEDLQVSGQDETYTEKKGASERYLKVNTSALTYMLINAVKEQQKIIEEKDRKVESLEQRLAKLEALVQKLSNN